MTLHAIPTRYRVGALFRRLTLALLVLLVSCPCLAQAGPIGLSPAEQAWVRAHPTIVVGTFKGGWPPFEQTGPDGLTGFSPDLLRELAASLGLSVEVRTFPSWSEALDSACRGEIDVLMNVAMVSNRTSCLVFTPPYMNTNTVAVERTGTERGDAAINLQGMRVAAERDYAAGQSVAERFPSAQMVIRDSTESALQAVKSGAADIYIGNSYVVSPLLRDERFHGLSITGWAELPIQTLHFAVSDDRKPLAGALSKALGAIDKPRLQEIKDRWLQRDTPWTEHDGDLPLTESERQWLGRLPALAIGYIGSWEPISFVADDHHASGIAGDYVEAIGTRLGIEFDDTPADSAEELVAMMASEQVALAVATTDLPLPDGWKLSKPLLSIGNVIVTRGDAPSVSGLQDLAGRRVVVVGSQKAQSIRSAIPDAIVDEVKDFQTGMRQVQTHGAFAYIGDVISVDRAIRSGAPSDLRVAAPAGFNDTLSIAVSDRHAELVPLIDRALSHMSDREQQKMRADWLSQPFEYGVEPRTVALITLTSLLIIGCLAIAYVRVRREINGRVLADRLLSDVTRNLPGIVFKYVLDPDGRPSLPFVAGNALPALGRPASELRGSPRTFLRAVSARHRKLLGQALSASAREMTEVSMDIRTSQAPGRWLHVNAVPRRLDSGAIHWSGYLVDVTEAHAQADALSDAKDHAEVAARAKSNFLAAMSHEIRTPMAGICGLVELLGKSSLDAGQRRMVAMVDESAVALRRILDDILDYSRIESGRMDLEVQPTDLRALVCSAVSLVQEMAQAKGLSLSCHLDASLAGTVVADGPRVRQIILNLLSNALKFTDTGHIDVALSVLGDTGTRQDWSITVTDTGIGVAAQAQEEIFKPFIQADPSTSRQYGGTGLGLPISRRLAEQMGGTLEMQSEPGKGTRMILKLKTEVSARSATDPLLEGVRVRVDVADAALRADLENIARVLGCTTATQRRPDVVISDAAPPSATDSAWIRVVDAVAIDDSANSIGAHPLLFTNVHDALRHALSAVARDDIDASPAPAQVTEFSDARILVVEDNPINQALIRSQLEELGAHCELASDGEEALAALSEHPFDLVITDVQMPVMDGLALTRRIRALEATEGARLPIVAMTAGVLPEEEAECLRAGMDAHVSKPASLAQIRAILVRWLPGVAARETEAQPSLGSPSVLQEAAKVFSQTCSDDLVQLRAAVHAADADGVASMLHRMSSAFVIFGYKTLGMRIRSSVQRILRVGLQACQSELQELIADMQYAADEVTGSQHVGRR